MHGLGMRDVIHEQINREYLAWSVWKHVNTTGQVFSSLVMYIGSFPVRLLVIKPYSFSPFFNFISSLFALFR